jgi:Zn-dependent protease
VVLKVRKSRPETRRIIERKTFVFNFLTIIAGIIGAVVTVTVHEWVKALVSYRLGDPLPKRDGRLTLNPLKHIEPIGFILMAFVGFGWGKPVETAAIYYKDRKKDTILTYTLPSASNLLLGVVLCLFLPLSVYSDTVHVILETTILFNLRHAFFNIIPVYPLDGAKVFTAIKNPNQVIQMATNQMFYQVILILVTVYGITGRVIDPVCLFIMSLFM